MTRSILLFYIPIAIVTTAPVPDQRLGRGPAESWQSDQSRENLMRFTIAVHGYESTCGHLPTDITDPAGKPLLSWRVAVLPYLDLEFLYDQFKLDEPWDSPHNRKLAAHMPDVFRAPVQGRTEVNTYYQAVAGPGAVFDPTAKVMTHFIEDGTSNTLLLVEAGPPVPWTKPADIPFDPDGNPPVLKGPYTDAVHVAVADGSTFRMTPEPDADGLTAFITRAGSEVYDPEKLQAAPAKPRTAAERKQLADSREYAKKLIREAAGNATDRFRVEEALRKRGDVPPTRPVGGRHG